MLKFRHLISLALVFAPALALGAAPEVEISIENHKFAPAEIEVPAGTKIKLKVVNKDATPEEFESYSLHREKIVPGKSTAVIFVGPLDKGEYEFFGEFHKDSAKGKLIVK